MKGLGVFLLGIAVFMVFSKDYEVDLGKGVVKFSSPEDTITQEFKSGNFQQFSTDSRVETQHGAPVDPQCVRFHSKNRLKNGDLLIVKRKVFGNNMRDGHRFIFYFYGAGDLGSCTAIMNGELGMDNKYHIHRFKREGSYSWMEVRTRFVLLK